MVLGGIVEGGRTLGDPMSVAAGGWAAISGPLISWPGGSAENTGIIVGVILGAYVIALWLTAIIWTARDVRSRSHDPVTQFVAVSMVLALNLPGWVLYRVLRPPLTLAELYERQLEEETLLRDLGHELACPTCSAPVDDDYVACPHCATSLKEPCEECGKALSFGWRSCPWCARERTGVASRAVASRSGVTYAVEEAPDAAPIAGFAETAVDYAPPRPIEAVDAGEGPFGKPRPAGAGASGPAWEPPGPVEGPRRVDSSAG